MSKERARRREVREAEVAARAERRAVLDARAARRRARKATWQRRLGPFAGGTTGQQAGILATRRRTRLRLILTALIFAQILTWIIRPDWPARLAALVVAVIAFPVIAAFAL